LLASIIYQSYQSGIEIWKRYWKRTCWVSINRTKVELKSWFIAFFFTLELRLSIVPKWNWNWRGSFNALPSMTYYQSYQSGIEMMQLKYKMSNERTINRTKVELKWGMDWRGRIPHPLSIVPKWNWNLKKAGLLRFYVTINRTKVELKLALFAGEWLRFVYQSYQSGIEITCRSGAYCNRELSIVPKWNWNKMFHQHQW